MNFRSLIKKVKNLIVPSLTTESLVLQGYDLLQSAAQT